MKVHKPFVITIVGAESSGKTKLASQLAEYLDCPWVPEYAREYLSSLDRAYIEKDLEIIAVRQLEEIQNFVSRESSVVNRESKVHFTPNSLKGTQKDYNDEHRLLIKSKIVIIDGGMMNLRMWARIKYNTVIPLVEESLKDDVTDLYLLCRPHKKWKPDPLREAPLLIDRVWIYNRYLDELIRSGKRIEIVSVRKGKKLRKVVQKIEQILQQENHSAITDQEK